MMLFDEINLAIRLEFQKTKNRTLSKQDKKQGSSSPVQPFQNGFPDAKPHPSSSIWPEPFSWPFSRFVYSVGSAETLTIPGSGNPQYLLSELARTFNERQTTYKVVVPISTGSAGAIRDVTNGTASSSAGLGDR